ncbi:hypothetical protein Pint_05379 [Pistacia integerrima]|uniref:Uncharacterized protein n=1 Tax=Pistacia integerrima TaxID=434235 RepID=A0ACC0Z6N0_9ROSI|nr:hypothetical protein Pint_05379 [Pistacia integerrima]
MLKKALQNAPPARDFMGALRAAHLRTGLPGLVAEVKRASPSWGIIGVDFDPVEIAQANENGGAACLSVLTDEKVALKIWSNKEGWSKGLVCNFPLLCKEFIIDAWQINYARTKGADAVLLIAAVFPHLDIRYMIKVCKMLGLAAVWMLLLLSFIFHDEKEMDLVLGIEGIELIGTIVTLDTDITMLANTCNLYFFLSTETFKVDINNTKKLLQGEHGQRIRQKDNIVVGESGLFTPDHITLYKKLVSKLEKNVLVGVSIVKQSDPAEGIAGLFGKDISL